MARALDVIGERWALLVVRELLTGPKRFAELARGLPTISQNVLSQRLRELTSDGIVTRADTGPASGGRGYELTDRGRQLGPALIELTRWAGVDLPTAGIRMSVDALVLALRSRFRPVAAAGLLAWLELRIAGEPFELMIADDELTIERGALDDPDATLDTDVHTLHELALGMRSLDQATATGAARLTGNGTTAARILDCFRPPGSDAPVVERSDHA